MKPTVLSASNEFKIICQELETLVTQTVAHRKKFQFAVSQFSQFSKYIAENATLSMLDSQKLDAFVKIRDYAQEFLQLFRANLLHCWAHYALENSVYQVATDLCTLVGQLHEAASIFEPSAAKFFDEAAPQWLSLHILDLRAIKFSFQQYLNHPKPNDPVVSIMTERLNSLDAFIKNYSSEDIAPGRRFFSPIPINYQNWRISYGNLTFERNVGEGVSAVVYYGHYTPPNDDSSQVKPVEVAIKKLKTKKMTGSALALFQREVTILATVKHPTLLGFVGATDTPPFCIVTQWMNGGTLYSDIHRTHHLDQTRLTIVAYDVARGMRFLHSHQIIHRDLKSLNILLDASGDSRICDFGFSKIVTKDSVMTQNIGTPHWMAPELFAGAMNYDTKVDVYAYGIVLWEILTGKLPYDGLDQTQIIAQVMMNNLRPPLPEDTPPKLSQLIQMCWDRDPHVRPTFDSIVRLLQTGDILFPGADKNAVLEHIRSSIDETDYASVDIENELTSSSKQSVASFVQVLTKDGMPQQYLEDCWNRLKQLKETSLNSEGDHTEEMAAYGAGLALFLHTQKAGDAAEELRRLPKNTLTSETVADVIMQVPTGSNAVDSSLVITACKNGAAILALLQADGPEDKKLAFEVISREKVKVDEFHRQAIIERCLQCLGDRDYMLTVAALRCLISIKEARNIPISQLKATLVTKNSTLRLTTFLAAAEMLSEGVELPIEIIDVFVGIWDRERLAGTIAVIGCTNQKIATHIIGRLSYGKTPQLELAIRLLAAASRHPSLKDDILKLIQLFGFDQAEEKVKNAAAALQAKLM